MDLSFFLKRMSKRVFRTYVDCPCDVCVEIYKEGLLIDSEIKFNSVRFALHQGKWFDTVEERDNWEKLHPSIS
jgi:hypothetical protein